MYAYLAVGVAAAAIGFATGAATMSAVDAHQPPAGTGATPNQLDPGMVASLPVAGDTVRTVSGPAGNGVCAVVSGVRGFPVAGQVSRTGVDAVGAVTGVLRWGA